MHFFHVWLKHVQVMVSILSKQVFEHLSNSYQISDKSPDPKWLSLWMFPKWISWSRIIVISECCIGFRSVFEQNHKSFGKIVKGQNEYLQSLWYLSRNDLYTEKFIWFLFDTLGVCFKKALFVPNTSLHQKVGSKSLPPSEVDLSWQFTLQKVWENLMQENKGKTERLHLLHFFLVYTKLTNVEYLVENFLCWILPCNINSYF